ncbi:MAG: DUF2225 domain-containing protein [Candidatus Riflebacteria bacterium]|nr:DUF2225 domain-containing protein [Candidatus Riflebacteria bacterium]
MFSNGTIINGNYKILASLGAGGMGAVFKALEKKPPRVVALKFLHKDYSKDSMAVKRFLQEGEILASLRHPFVVEIFSLETDSETQLPFLIMEYFSGKVLTDFIAEFSKNPFLLTGTFLNLIEGVKAFHSRNIIHRDLKPSNILINSSGELKIIDFGIAKGTKRQTQTGMALGTPHYMSPEQCEGNPDITTASDIYSLGAVLWELVTGKAPFDATEDSSDPFLAIVLKHLNAPVPLEKLSRTPHGHLFSELLSRMLDKKPENRPGLDFIFEYLVQVREKCILNINEAFKRYSPGIILQQGKSGKLQVFKDCISDSSVLIYLLSGIDESKVFVINDRIERYSRITAPYLAEILQKGYVAESDSHYLVMQALGNTQFEKLTEIFQKDRIALAVFMLKILETLSAIHNDGLIHGNLNPATVGFNSDGEAMITGFPMTPFFNTDNKQDMQFIAYLAPECLSDAAKISVSSDVYSLGILFWRILFGELPKKLQDGNTKIVQNHTLSLGETITLEPVSLKDPLFPFLELLCRMIKSNPAERPTIGELLSALRPITGNAIIPPKKILKSTDKTRKISAVRPAKNKSSDVVSKINIISGDIDGSDGDQCLIFTRDDNLDMLLSITLKEYGFRFQRATSFEDVSRLSQKTPTLAWFLDLDSLTRSIVEITEHAMKFAPDAKVIFFAGKFSRELIESCLQQEVTALLAKPIIIPRLVQTLNALKEEPELLENESLFPLRFNFPELENLKSGENYQHVMFYQCGICGERFGSLQLKPGAFEFRGIETDFCPICPPEIVPELYSIIVCPTCFYANFSGRFQRVSFSEAIKKEFMSNSHIQERLKKAQGIDFLGERRLEEGLRSFDLAVSSIQELAPREYERIAGEFLLKASWLARRKKRPLEEIDYQAQALGCLMTLYRPYLRINEQFPEWHAIKEKLKPGLELMKERAVVVTGFLAAELSARLGLNDEASFYFDQVFALPFLQRFALLSRHIHRSFLEFQNKQKAKS